MKKNIGAAILLLSLMAFLNSFGNPCDSLEFTIPTKLLVCQNSQVEIKVQHSYPKEKVKFFWFKDSLGNDTLSVLS